MKVLQVPRARLRTLEDLRCAQATRNLNYSDKLPDYIYYKESKKTGKKIDGFNFQDYTELKKEFNNKKEMEFTRWITRLLC